MLLAGSLCHKDSWLPCTESYRPPRRSPQNRGGPLCITYNGVASGVSSDIVTAFQLLEAGLGHIGSENFRHFGFISGFLQSVGKSSDPSEISLWCEVFEEHGAFVRIAEMKNKFRKLFLPLHHLLSGHTLVAVPLTRAELGRGEDRQHEAAGQARHHGASHLHYLQHGEH